MNEKCNDLTSITTTSHLTGPMISVPPGHIVDHHFIIVRSEMLSHNGPASLWSVAWPEELCVLLFSSSVSSYFSLYSINCISLWGTLFFLQLYVSIGACFNFCNKVDDMMVEWTLVGSLTNQTKTMRTPLLLKEA